MPMFEFRCPHCGTSQEVLLKSSQYRHLCTCGGLMDLQVSKPNFELKGGGWFKDGYK